VTIGERGHAQGVQPGRAARDRVKEGGQRALQKRHGLQDVVPFQPQEGDRAHRQQGGRADQHQFRMKLQPVPAVLPSSGPVSLEIEDHRETKSARDETTTSVFHPKQADPKRDAQDQHQLDDFHRRQSPGRVQAVANGGTAQHRAEVVTHGIAQERCQGDASKTPGMTNMADPQQVVTDQDHEIEGRQDIITFQEQPHASKYARTMIIRSETSLRV